MSSRKPPAKKQPASTVPVERFVMPWNDEFYEAVLRQKFGSFMVAVGWDIGLSPKGWQVFWMGIDANYRIGHKEVKYHETFREAYEWIQNLSDDEWRVIASRGSA